jgi:1-acyl-sn-glycerol-3-phosphate acyltransferase
MSEAWTYPEGTWQSRYLTPLSRWVFRRVARVYGFISMPPMPPRPGELEARALAVLRAVRLARRAAREGGMVGLAPEGQDTPDELGEPPENAGRFMALLIEAGLPVLPVGVTELGGWMRVAIGPAFWPEVPAGRAERDEVVTVQVMAEIRRAMGT